MIEREIELPDAPAIPRLRFRPFAIDRDLPALVDLIGEANLADTVDWLPTVENLRSDIEHRPTFDPPRDLLLAEIDGRLVAAAETTWRIRAGRAVHYTECWVRPDHRRRGLGRSLLHWVEHRAREVAAASSGDLPHVYGSWPDAGETGRIALLESEGYRPIRYGFMMIRPLTEPIPELRLPAPLEIRPVREPDHRKIWDADVEAFRDHWEAAVRTEDDYAAFFTSPDLDTSLWRVAWDGNEVCGSVMTYVFPEENERLGVERGWLEHISVRRPWRKRGVASALIVDSLRALKERGLAEAALGVDAENTTGALGVYESLGFRRHKTGINYRKAF